MFGLGGMHRVAQQQAAGVEIEDREAADGMLLRSTLIFGSAESGVQLIGRHENQRQRYAWDFIRRVSREPREQRDKDFVHGSLAVNYFCGFGRWYSVFLSAVPPSGIKVMY